MSHDPIAGPTTGSVNRNTAKPVGKNRKQQAAKDDPSGTVGKRRGTKASATHTPVVPVKRKPSRHVPTSKQRTESGSENGAKQPLPVFRPRLTRRGGGK
jgi:hypothetical protein